MAKGSRGRRRFSSRQYRSAPYPSQSNRDIFEDLCPRKCSKNLVEKDWEDATCSVCMEYPHNAVLLLCSSHEKGCRPYMCGTSFRHSNCLDQYKKAYTKIVSSDLGQSLRGSAANQILVPNTGLSVDKCEATELACPLCRGQVKGWTVLEPAREFLDAKHRSCMQEKCLFIGNYKELRKHVKAEHPLARPREVDPIVEQKWRSLERAREQDDVISTIQSSMPGAMFFGDYVIEGNSYGIDPDEEDGGFDSADAAGRNAPFGLGLDVVLLWHAFGSSGRMRQQHERAFHQAADGNVGIRHTSPVGASDSSDLDEENESNEDGDDDDDDGNMSLVSRLRRQGRVLLGRSERRRRHREANSEEQ